MSPAGLFFLIFHAGFIPWAVLRSRKKLGDRLPQIVLKKHLVGTIVQLALFFVLAMGVAHVEWIELFSAPTFRIVDAGAGAAMLAIAIAVMTPRWKRNVERGAPLVKLFAPHTPGERALWLGVSAMAALAEECTYRGVMFVLVARISGSELGSAAFCSAIFAIVHMVQGPKTAVVIGVFALAFHGLVALTGSLYVAMAVHFLYDATAGFMYGHFDSIRVQSAAAEPAAVPESNSPIGK